ncbi:MAG TPA: nuclear transport factor 2 family protein [Pyrinomonadaceae bacterium]|nr:nuclear transport factor 2 family protein [Pyrinomonadaceae bacterium]
MKTRILIAMLLCSWTINGQTPLQEMVQTEQSFSRMAAEKNTRDAFLAFIADDGLLFRPGAVNGKKWMLEHPTPPPPDNKRPLLAWQPSFAGMAAAGDLGFTTGPWEAKQDVNDTKPSGYGHFVTLWKKQPDGTWKFVVDLGISHPQSGGPQTLWHPQDQKSNAKLNPVNVDTARAALLDLDRAYAQESVKQGLLWKAFIRYTSRDVRLYRNGSLPFIGATASANALHSETRKVNWTPLGGDVSRSGDLGYTHGTYEITDAAAAKVAEHGSYVRIWKKENGAWRVVLDVANPHR